MNWISNLLSRYGRNVHFITIGLLSVVLIYGGYTVRAPDAGSAVEAADPAVVSDGIRNDSSGQQSQRPSEFNFNRLLSEGLVTVFYYPFFTVRNSITDLIRVNEDNRRYHQALVEISVRLSMAEENRRENDRLRAILGFEPPPTYMLLPAEVVSVTGDRMPVSAIINRGQNDAVYVNQPIINEDGLIGRVSAVTPHFAVVQLLTDPGNRVASRVADSRDMGIAKYVIGEGLILDNFPIQAEIKQGDTIVSSGLGGVYPSGLVVGTVASVEREEEAVFARVHLKPAVNFRRLDELFLLRQEAQ